MSQLVYRIETLPGNGHVSIAVLAGEGAASDVLRRLTELGRAGWHVSALLARRTAGARGRSCSSATFLMAMRSAD